MEVLSDQDNSASTPWIIAITGASGVRYGIRLLEVLQKYQPQLRLEVVVSEAGLRVIEEEVEAGPDNSQRGIAALIGKTSPQVAYHKNCDITAPFASGSCAVRGMLIVPCSMKTLAAIAHGYADNLIVRSADVMLKESRPLILVPRETPLSPIHLRNMLSLAEAGAKIVPAMPGFYHRPQAVEHLVDMMVMRIIDQMGYHIDLVKRWDSPHPCRRSSCRG